MEWTNSCATLQVAFRAGIEGGAMNVSGFVGASRRGVQCKVSSGSTTSCMSQSLADELGLMRVPASGASGSHCQVILPLGHVEMTVEAVPVCVGGVTAVLPFLVLSNYDPRVEVSTVPTPEGLCEPCAILSWWRGTMLTSCSATSTDNPPPPPPHPSRSINPSCTRNKHYPWPSLHPSIHCVAPSTSRPGTHRILQGEPPP